MNKLVFLFFIALLFVAYPAQAQWQRVALRGLKKPSVKMITTRTLAMQRAINQTARKTSLPNQLSQSTLILKLPQDKPCPFYDCCDINASAFIFEENYKGKTYLWGATASHYFLQKPLLENTQTGEEFPVQIVAKGHHGRNDISLFPIPAPLQNQFKPLKLANHSPKKGEALHSAGYFDDGFQVEKDRTVTDILPTRILTSLVVEDKLAREGACGGPVLNKKEEIVGMHVGSSNKQIGFVVPVEYIYEILQAYHNHGKALRPFYFNGRKLGNINVNEYIHAIEVWQGEKQLHNFIAYPRRAYIDYEHLEKLVDYQNADKIVFVIERVPFSVTEEDQHLHQFKITYNLRTLQVSERERL